MSDSIVTFAALPDRMFCIVCRAALDPVIVGGQYKVPVETGFFEYRHPGELCQTNASILSSPKATASGMSGPNKSSALTSKSAVPTVDFGQSGSGEVARCQLCGEPMPEGEEEMFNYHGYSGPCPKPPSLNSPAPATGCPHAGKSFLVKLQLYEAVQVEGEMSVPECIDVIKRLKGKWRKTEEM